ncbi:MAG: type IV pilus biogenesis/stability protein PilW [Rubrivivax sp.]
MNPRASAAGLALAALAALAGCAQLPANSERDLPTLSDLSEAERLARVRLELASAYFSRGQNAVALDEVKLALAARPDFPEALNLRGLVYAALGEVRLAEESFRRAQQLAPRDGDVLHNHGWFLCNQGRFAEAEALFRQVLALPGLRDSPRTQLAWGVCLARNGQLSESERVLTAAFESDPSNLALALNLADVLYRRGEWDRARFYLRRVHAQPEQGNAQSLWLAARVEHRGGHAGARDRFGQELSRRFPQSREALLWERGRFDE